MTILASILLLATGAAVAAPVGEWPSATFVAEKSRHTISVRGHLLSDREKERFLAAAKEAGADIASFEYGRYIVLPDWWSSAVDAMVPLADLMHTGEIRLSRSELVLEALATEDVRWAEAMTALEQTLPAGFPVLRQLNDIAEGRKAQACDRLFDSLDRCSFDARRHRSRRNTMLD